MDHSWDIMIKRDVPAKHVIAVVPPGDLAVAFYIADSEDLSPANGGGGGEIRTRFTHRRQPFKPVATRA